VALFSFYKDKGLEAGCDEAGRGCLAGPVFAAAVILSRDTDIPLLNDSKQLSNAQRYELRDEIEKKAIAFSVASLDNEEIDNHNIFKSSILAMHRAIEGLSTLPELLLIDGKYFYDYDGIPHQCIIKGDGKYLSIAAASVLAKTYRDDYMIKLDKAYPNYSWKSNKGYPTKQHRQAIKDFGITPFHRKSFRLLPEAQQLKIKDL
jgi:ribonuclease HII